ncbi:MAG: 50S ribosomal protein L9 [Candidatus Absconditabacterales bacterium]|nr:50S ribosomal protein L9 [Candidatus Absconditabacterales bacterium]
MPKRSEKNRKISVILLQFHKHLGEQYDVVRVAPVYARNVLLPNKIAVLATPDNLHSLQQKITHARNSIEKKIVSLGQAFDTLLSLKSLDIPVAVNDKGTFYAKIHADDIVNHIQSTYNISLDPDCIVMKKSLDTLGEHPLLYVYKTFRKSFTISLVKKD